MFSKWAQSSIKAMF
ncbi:TPA: hypothetical protein KMA16_003674 [Escherichia coli]|nr:hypothetical protein [Escherichia coli]MDY3836491.1 hypothetical protein [Escherichia coli]HBE5191826.1 hypothetical protein [Escherichia coli]HBE5290836.1 hypothetical protein [Escherichia coli]